MGLLISLSPLTLPRSLGVILLCTDRGVVYNTILVHRIHVVRATCSIYHHSSLARASFHSQAAKEYAALDEC